MKEVKTYWYVEPEDGHTNEVIAKNLLAIGSLNENLSLLDIEGRERSVYQIEDYAFITRLYKDEKKFNLSFKVFYRQSRYGQLRPWKFGQKKQKILKKNQTKNSTNN